MKARPMAVATAIPASMAFLVLVAVGVASWPMEDAFEFLAQLRFEFLKKRSSAMGRIFQLVARMKSSMGRRPSSQASRMVVLVSVRNSSARHSWK
jgi:hypothetical protein